MENIKEYVSNTEIIKIKIYQTTREGDFILFNQDDQGRPQRNDYTWTGHQRGGLISSEEIKEKHKKGKRIFQGKGMT